MPAKFLKMSGCFLPVRRYDSGVTLEVGITLPIEQSLDGNL